MEDKLYPPLSHPRPPNCNNQMEGGQVLADQSAGSPGDLDACPAPPVMLQCTGRLPTKVDRR